jgi:predicted nucleic acid-binding protein
MLGSKCERGFHLSRLGSRSLQNDTPIFLGELLALPGVHGNLVPDAHLAVLAVEHGLTLCSTDGDFARFQRLRWLNPISS